VAPSQQPALAAHRSNIREWYCPQARIAGPLTFQPVGGSAASRCFIIIAQECDAFATYRGLSTATLSRIRTCITADLAPLRTNAARPVRASRPGRERGRLGSYRSALGLCWDGSAGYWIRRGVGRLARGGRAQYWTADRVCTPFSLRNHPTEESRPPCIARARRELGDGVFFKTFSRGMGAIGVNGPARFFRRAFDQKLASFDERFAGGEIFGAEKGQRKQCTQPCTLAAARSGGARIAKACIGRFVTASERRKKRVATAEASKHSISPADEYTRSYPGQ